MNVKERPSHHLHYSNLITVMANRRTPSSKIQKIDEDSDFDQEFSPSQESVMSEGEQQRKYAIIVYPSLRVHIGCSEEFLC